MTEQDGCGKNGNKSWQSLKSALVLMKENAQTKSDFFIRNGFSM